MTVGRRRSTWRSVSVLAGLLAFAALLAPLRATAVDAASVEAETLSGGAPIADATASGGAFMRGPRVEATSTLPSGVQRIRARVRAAGPVRVDLLSNGAMTGSWTVSGSTWEVIEAVAFVATGQRVGVAGFNAEGEAPAVDVDWIQSIATAATYTVRGNQILDLGGAPVRFRGINLRGHHTPRNYGGRLEMPPVQAQDLYVWGADSVRIALNQEHWLANCAARRAGHRLRYRDAIADEVNAITAKGMWALITLTVVERGQATGCQQAEKPHLKEMADNRSVPFWTSVASTFRSNPRVAFDLFNEPRDIGGALWRNGGTVSYRVWQGGVPRSRSYRGTGMQQLYNTVRATGATNPVVIGGLDWASEPETALIWPLDGYGIVLGTHTYCKSCTRATPGLPRTIDTRNSATVRARHPLVLTEGGWGYQDDGRYNRALITWAEERAIGWMIYAFMRPADYSLVKQWSNTFHAGHGYYTKPPSRSGAPVWNSFAPVRAARGYPPQPQPE
jgi:endoglucanase